MVFTFYNRLYLALFKLWGHAASDLKIIFDDCQDEAWRGRIEFFHAGFADFLKNKTGMQLNVLPVEFRSKLEAIPIQAADMVAYRTNQVARNVKMGKSAVKIETAFDKAFVKKIKMNL